MSLTGSSRFVKITQLWLFLNVRMYVARLIKLTTFFYNRRVEEEWMLAAITTLLLHTLNCRLKQQKRRLGC